MPFKTGYTGHTCFIKPILGAKAVPLEQNCQFPKEIQCVVTGSSIPGPRDFLEYMQATAYIYLGNSVGKTVQKKNKKEKRKLK